MARMWVASAGHAAEGGWIETFVTMETMDAHLWSARESTGLGAARGLGLRCATSFDKAWT